MRKTLCLALLLLWFASLAACSGSTDHTFQQLVLICGQEEVSTGRLKLFNFQILFIYRTECRLFQKKPLQGCVLDIFYSYEGCSTAGTGNTIADTVTFIKIDMDH